MSFGPSPSPDPEQMINVHGPGTSVDVMGQSTTIEVLVGGIETISYSATVDLIYDGPGASGTLDDVMASEDFSGYTEPNDNDSLILDASHAVIAGQQNVKVGIDAQITGDQVNKEWFPNISPEPIDQYVYTDSFAASQSPGSLSGTIPFDVNVVNETIANVDITFAIDGGVVSSTSPQGINVPFDFSSSREVDVELQGQEEVCCTAVDISSTGR
jgi:hypothetical protein